MTPLFFGSGTKYFLRSANFHNLKHDDFAKNHHRAHQGALKSLIAPQVNDLRGKRK